MLRKATEPSAQVAGLGTGVGGFIDNLTVDKAVNIL